MENQAVAVANAQAMKTEAESDRFIRVGAVRIAYREGGEGGEPVLLIHGLCSMTYTWRDVFAALAARRRVIALDLKGFGASDKLAGDYRLAAQGEIVLRLMDALEINQAALIGNSLGGAVALQLAQRQPERVARLVLLDPVAYQSHARALLARWLLTVSGRAGQALALHLFGLLLRSPAMVENRMRAIYSRHEIITPERIAAYHALLRDPGCQRAIITTLRDWDVRAIERALPLVSQPALILWGAHDRIIPPSFGQRLVRDLPRAQLQLLPCGHAPQEELPEECARLMNDFLSLPDGQATR
jgi:pimeloyl-ACP methyl ester carboxylesterase